MSYIFDTFIIIANQQMSNIIYIFENELISENEESLRDSWWEI